ncbi:MAG: serine hydrolase [Planctomycetaceae bacterium]
MVRVTVADGHSVRPQPRFIAIGMMLITAMPFAAARTTVADDSQSLQGSLLPLIEAHAGDVAVCVRHLSTGETFQHQSDKVMPTASLIKLAVMIEAYRQVDSGTRSLTDLLEIREDDKVPGSGILTRHFGTGSKLTLRDAIRLMIAWSDNTATNLVVDHIGLPSTAETMEKLGFPETRLHSKVYRGSTSIFPERSKIYGLGSTTAADITTLLEQLHNKTLLTPAACESMLDHLRHCEDRSKLPRFLPDDMVIAHKSGAVSKSRCDAGILFTTAGPIVICVLTNDNTDRRWNDDNAAEVLCGRIAKTVVDHFNPPHLAQSATDRSILKLGDFGRTVEAVQRTLNARSEPSPDLSIDGDYGPATQAAVIQFQTAHKLPPTGKVESDTWVALSPLLTDRVPVPDPDVVNSETLPVQSADDANGPPFVTCRAWAIADGATGQLLESHNADIRMDIASTTKIMTAHLVFRLAESNPTVLDESITFSRRADRTRGSTSAIEEAETLPVRELLYGLLLPSGNDAAVALAEHFGTRFTAEDRSGQITVDDSVDPLPLFIDEMNRMAIELKMENTTFRNPHGLTQDGHQSTAADLVKLTTAALQQPLFRQYVSTRQHGCTVTGPGGYTRNVLWKNTNRLLGIDGYLGVKTGTTDSAGACLVSFGQRGDVQRLLVVLGSESSAGRYVDTRNLYRRAWQQSPPTDDASHRE